MSYIIVGLGNPGEEYVNTRHNTGRMILDHIRQELDGADFEFDKKINALVSEVKVGKEKVTLVAPETFMNNSGKCVGQLVKTKKNAKLKLITADDLLVIYDDFQLPIGRMKISYNKSSGGHNGLESVIKAIKTEAFPRLRVGTAPATAKGDAKIPHGDDKILKFILSSFKPDEMKTIKKLGKRAAEGVQIFVKEGRDKATGVVNGMLKVQ
ncbi:MAG: aminoacyl-tRNA hydrolase [Candidatus Taylorbacteria bacterium]|nr:aminoacyl-tRNA hydrolase [Candidatus Taylorbacteria bacterium]